MKLFALGAAILAVALQPRAPLSLDRIVVHQVHFNAAGEVAPDSSDMLTAAAQALQDKRVDAVRIVASCSSAPISEQVATFDGPRAKAIRRYLKAHGVRVSALLADPSAPCVRGPFTLLFQVVG